MLHITAINIIHVYTVYSLITEFQMKLRGELWWWLLAKAIKCLPLYSAVVIPLLALGCSLFIVAGLFC